MFVFAIETCGKTVALIQEDNRTMLEGFLNGEREDGQILRRDIVQPIYWDGLSPFKARLATASEELDYHFMNEGISESDSESLWYFYYNDITPACLDAEREQAKAQQARVPKHF
jgi:hypothetical protein